MPDFRYTLFDLDGTLTDSAPGITASVKYALKKSGEPVPDYTVLCKFIGPPLLYGFMSFCGMSGERAEKAVEYYREYYSVNGIFESELYPGVDELLAKLCAAGKKIILATSKPEIFAVKILEHFRLSDYFYFTAGATLDKTRTEKADVIAYALKSVGITDLSETVMVGDRFHDIEGAKANGIRSAGVLYGFGNRTELEKAGADFIAGDTNELCRILLGSAGTGGAGKKAQATSVKSAFYDTDIGIIEIGVTDSAVSLIRAAGQKGESVFTELSDEAFRQITEYLSGKRQKFDLPLKITGTDFQKKVYSALLDIPYGETASYGEIAAKTGNPKAARAVGGACNKNPLLLAVPCHRVVGASGSLTGFAAGIETKKKLIELEKANKII